MYCIVCLFFLRNKTKRIKIYIRTRIINQRKFFFFQIDDIKNKSVSMSTGRSNAYSRPSSITRPMPPTVSSISRSIQSGSMNVTSTTIRQRPNSGLRQASTDRGSIPSVQRRTSSDITRSRLSSNQDQSVS